MQASSSRIVEVTMKFLLGRNRVVFSMNRQEAAPASSVTRSTADGVNENVFGASTMRGQCHIYQEYEIFPMNTAGVDSSHRGGVPH